MTNYQKNERTLKRISESFRKYNLTVRFFQCRFNPKTQEYEYRLICARRNSGSRGGRLRNHRYWTLINLYHHQRNVISLLPHCREEQLPK